MFFSCTVTSWWPWLYTVLWKLWNKIIILISILILICSISCRVYTLLFIAPLRWSSDLLILVQSKFEHCSQIKTEPPMLAETCVRLKLSDFQHRLLFSFFQSCSLAFLPPRPLLVYWFLETCYIHCLWLFVCFLSHWTPLQLLFVQLSSILFVNKRWLEVSLSGWTSAKCSVAYTYMGVCLNLFHHTVKHSCN